MSSIYIDGKRYRCSDELYKVLIAKGFSDFPSPESKPIDWSRIPTRYVAVAMDASGYRYAYTEVPTKRLTTWGIPDPFGWRPVDAPGERFNPAGWEDSLVLRP